MSTFVVGTCVLEWQQTANAKNTQRIAGTFRVLGPRFKALTTGPRRPYRATLLDSNGLVIGDYLLPLDN